MLTIENIDIESTKSIKLVGIAIDDRLRFDQHMSNLRSKAVMQLNALGRLKIYMGKLEKIALNSFIYANFDFCPLVWHFSTCELIRKIEKTQKRCLRIALDDYESNNDILLRKSGKVTMEIKRLTVLVIETFKTPKLHPKVRLNDILVKHHNTHHNLNMQCKNFKNIRS